MSEYLIITPGFFFFLVFFIFQRECGFEIGNPVSSHNYMSDDRLCVLSTPFQYDTL